MSSRLRETADTVSLTLTPAGDEALGPFDPGQFAMLYAFGVGEIPVSVSRIGQRELVHTIRSVGAVSAALCALRPGKEVGVRGPFGTGWEPERAAGQDIVVVAGGIGLAPLRPLVLAALAAPRAYGRLNLLAGTRSTDDLLFAERMRTWAASPGPPHCRVTADRPAPAWWGHVGLVTTLLNTARFTPGNTTAYVCGPEVMIRATARDLLHRGVPAHRIRVSLERNMRCATGHCGHCQLGTVTDACLVPPTAQNQGAIEDDLVRTVEQVLAEGDPSDEELTHLCERAIRNHDPCISCSTHFLDLTIART